MSLLIERLYPYALGCFGAILTFILTPNLADLVAAETFDVNNFYTAIFGFATVLTGFLGTFYAIVVASPTRFMRQVRRTVAFQRFRSYLKQALGLGFGLTLLSLVKRGEGADAIEEAKFYARVLAAMGLEVCGDISQKGTGRRWVRCHVLQRLQRIQLAGPPILAIVAGRCNAPEAPRVAFSGSVLI